MTSDGELGNSGKNVGLWIQEVSAFWAQLCLWLADLGQIKTLCLSTSFLFCLMSEKHKIPPRLVDYRACGLGLSAELGLQPWSFWHQWETHSHQIGRWGRLGFTPSLSFSC